VVWIANDDVVENFDFEKLTGSNEVTGDFYVRFRWGGISARVRMLCEAPTYVQLPVGGADAGVGAKGKGVLCLKANHFSGPSRTRPFAC